MNDGLQQMTAEYNPQQDRILFRISNELRVEYQVWLTRRLVGMFWGQAVKLFNAGSESDKVKNAMTSMKHQDVVQTSNFSQKHAAASNTKSPLLATGMTCGFTPEGSIRMTFHSAEKRDINLDMNEDMLHALCHIIQKCADKAGWALDLKMGDGAVVVQPEVRHVH